MIYDSDDNPISSFTHQMEAASIDVLPIQVDCEEDHSITAIADAGITVEGRLSGVGSYVDLETTPIDLTPYAGTRQAFEIRLTASSPAVLTRVSARVRVAYA